MHLRFPRPVRTLGFGGWIFASLMTVVLAVVVRAFVVETFKIPSTSMLPTLLVGDRIIVNKLAYGIYLPWSKSGSFYWDNPQRGDVVVFYRFSEFEDVDAEKHFIKRIAAVPGDIVEVRDYSTFVNGKPLSLGSELGYGDAMLEGGRNYGPHKLGDGQYFALGDNQSNSRDSRYFGPIHLSDIKGKAWLVYWSWRDVDATSREVRWERFLKRIQ